MQYILTEEEYKAFTAPPVNDNPIVENYHTETIKMRTKYRTKELKLYNPEPYDGYVGVGSIQINTDWIINYSDDEWDALIDKVDAEFYELNQPLPNADMDTEELIDVLPKNENQVIIMFSEEQPFVEDNVSKSVIRFYPKVYEKQASVLDRSKFKIVDNGEVQGLQFTIYTSLIPQKK